MLCWAVCELGCCSSPITKKSLRKSVFIKRLYIIRMNNIYTFCRWGQWGANLCPPLVSSEPSALCRVICASGCFHGSNLSFSPQNGHPVLHLLGFRTASSAIMVTWQAFWWSFQLESLHWPCLQAEFIPAAAFSHIHTEILEPIFPPLGPSGLPPKTASLNSMPIHFSP